MRVAGLNAYAFHLSSNLWAGVVAGFVYLVAFALTQQRTTAVVRCLVVCCSSSARGSRGLDSSRKDLVAAVFVLPVSSHT